MSEDRFQLQRLLEAILFASAEPLTVDALAARMPEGADIPGLLQEIRDLYANRGVNLTPVEDRWCFRTAPDLSSKFHVEQKVERKLTRAAIETLAIIAYHQPVTRAEIEEIRGVAISKGTLDNLLEAGWIKPKGRRQTPGRPVTWVTTEGFLEHFGLESCDALPGVEELRAAGLLDSTANAATLGVQGHLPPGGGEGEEGDEDGEDGDEQGVADDAYDAEMLARLEGEAAQSDGAGNAAREAAETTDGEIAAEELAGGFEPVDIAEAGVDDEDLDEADLDGEEDETDEESELEEELENEAFEEDVAEEEAAVALHDVNDDDGEDGGDSPDGDDDDDLDEDDVDEDDVDEEGEGDADGDDEDELEDDDLDDEDELEDDDLEEADDLDEDELDEDDAGEGDEGDDGEGEDETHPADRKLDAG